MGLCCACLGISSSGLFDRYTEPPSTEQPWEYVHLQEASLLPSSATSCPLCSLIVESLIDQLQLSNRDSWKVLYQHLNGPLRIQLHASDMLLYVQYKGDGPDRVISSRLCASIKRGSTAPANLHFYRFPTLSANSTEAFGLAQYWIDDCQRNHKSCRTDFIGREVNLSDFPLIPSRIIDVGLIAENQRPRLIEGRKMGIRARYAALSHCWGNEQSRPITTTKANIRSHFFEGLHIENLSRTFQDAILITQKLGLRYLWVDSLCIIQDDHSDWERESAVMGAIYRDSYITIFASGASDGSRGCFLERSYFDAVEISVRSSCGKPSLDTYFFSSAKSRQVQHSLSLGPLHERAWITQEWILPPRVIHYTQDRMVWSCRAKTESEMGILHVSSHTRGRQWKEGFFGQPSEELDSSKLLPALSVYHSWCSVVSAYSARKLTIITDKLVAIQGLVNEMEEGLEELVGKQDYYDTDNNVSRDKCTFGLWQNRLVTQLAWKRPWGDGPLLRPPALRKLGIPSRSWASVDGPIKFQVKRAKDVQKYQKRSSTELGDLYMGPVVESPGRISLRVPCARVLGGTHHLGKSTAVPEVDDNWALVDELKTYVGTAQTDDARCPFGSYYAVPLYTKRASGTERISGLLLKPCQDAPSCYERVGLVSVEAENLFQRAPVLDVIIV